MICRLCEREKPLMQFHIIPELLVKPCYDDKHRARVRSLPSFGTHVVQWGYRERLLCEDCEARFSRCEHYFSNVWYGRKALRPQVAPQLGFVLEGLDYKRFKLFHLSILWRAGISEREEYRSVQLGPHIKTLARLLLADDPGPPNRYPVGAVALVHRPSNSYLESSSHRLAGEEWKAIRCTCFVLVAACGVTACLAMRQTGSQTRCRRLDV
jgi:hypothetical protein